MVSHTEGRTKSESAVELGAEKDIWANEECVNREKEKTAQQGDLHFVHLVVKSTRINGQTKCKYVIHKRCRQGFGGEI